MVNKLETATRLFVLRNKFLNAFFGYFKLLEYGRREVPEAKPMKRSTI
jgi:hypothetical protein